MLPFIPNHFPPAFQTKASHFLGPLVSSGKGGGWRDMTDRPAAAEASREREGRAGILVFPSPPFSLLPECESVLVFGRNEGLQIHETPAKSNDKVEYLGAVGALGRSLVPCPWESAQPCRVSGQSREKCLVRNLDGKEGEGEGEMHLTL